jgi:citrate/tricarballylate utilization protein
MLAAEGAGGQAGQMLAVCNACRYCEQYCPVFPAMERRTAFPAEDLHYLANLCHNCGECLYACQYAPPHPFAVNLPRALAEVRGESYERYCWPPALGIAFHRQGALLAIGLTAGFTALVFAFAGGGTSARRPGPGDFYAVIPHDVMVGVFGGVFLVAVVALGMSLARYWRAIRASELRPVPLGSWVAALRDAATLRHLHGGGVDCASDLDRRTPWRRWAHHATLGGFASCFASTTVAAVYHSFFGWTAPHGYLSVPVVLGVAGGLGLVIGPMGLLLQRARRDAALSDPAQRGLDSSLLVLLLVTSATGLVLLAWRHTAAMRPLLFVHLGAVLAFFVTIPYSKFVHGFYRLLALVQAEDESRGDSAAFGE